MPRIATLSAAELARHATNVFIFAGRHQAGARLIYHALMLDPYEPEALRGLSNLLEWEGTEQLSALVLEYALAPDSPLSQEVRAKLDDALFMAKWTWSFSRHEEGATAIGWEDLADRSRFIVDEEGYRRFLEPVIVGAGSVEGAFRAAHTLIGVMGGLLAHKVLGEQAPLEEAYHLERFEVTPAYAEWLRSDTAELDTLEQARKAHTGRN